MKRYQPPVFLSLVSLSLVSLLVFSASAPAQAKAKAKAKATVQASVVLRDGTTVAGTLLYKTVKIQTDFGHAVVNAGQIRLTGQKANQKL